MGHTPIPRVTQRGAEECWVTRGTAAAQPRSRAGRANPTYQPPAWVLLRRGERRCRLLQHEVVFDLEERRGDGLAGRRLARRPLDEIDDQRLLHAVDHV